MRNSKPLALLILTLLSPLHLDAEGPDAVAGAIAVQQQLVSESPTNANAFNDLGNLLLLAKESDAASAAYEQAVSLNPELLSAHFNLGLLRAQQGDRDAAKASFQRVLELEPAHAWSHYQLGRLDEMSGRNRQALSSYTEAFRLDPTLSFTDVNPQVLDSKLTTRALLSLDAGAASASEAPRAYEDPFRIASLLLPKLPEESEAETPPTPSDVAADPFGTSESDLEDSEAEPSPSKTLSSRDLDSDSAVGQADPPAVGSQRPAGRTPNRAGRASRVPSRDTAGARSSGHVGGSDRLNRGSTAGRNTERSTGQLRTRLVPDN